jgi:hypothetical protein
MRLLSLFFILTFFVMHATFAEVETLKFSSKRYISFTIESNHLVGIENNLGRFTALDAIDLRAQFLFLNTKHKRLASFVLEMFPLDVEVPPQMELQRISFFNKDEEQPKKGWTEICELIGKKNVGRYTDGAEQEIVGEAIVGDRTKRCFGRCGAGCVPLHVGTYTQECFNHDLCHRTTGENWGICKDEFMLASDGYIHAPRCK